jgi:hypothetical protein
MAHFAELDENNMVLRVIVIDTKDNSDENGNEKEEIGIAFCQNLFGGTWKQTSYNHNIRKRYAGIGYIYDEALDAFIRPKPYPSWNFDEETADWHPPIPIPEDDKQYEWDEESKQWKLLQL